MVSNSSLKIFWNQEVKQKQETGNPFGTKKTNSNRKQMQKYHINIDLAAS